MGERQRWVTEKEELCQSLPNSTQAETHIQIILKPFTPTSPAIFKHVTKTIVSRFLWMLSWSYFYSDSISPLIFSIILFNPLLFFLQDVFIQDISYHFMWMVSSPLIICVMMKCMYNFTYNCSDTSTIYMFFSINVNLNKKVYWPNKLRFTIHF